VSAGFGLAPHFASTQLVDVAAFLKLGSAEDGCSPITETRKPPTLSGRTVDAAEYLGELQFGVSHLSPKTEARFPPRGIPPRVELWSDRLHGTDARSLNLFEEDGLRPGAS